MKKITKQKNIDNFADGFTEDQKKGIVNSALTTAGQVLMSAVVLTGVHNYITGECIYPDGSKWIIRFEKKDPEVK